MIIERIWAMPNKWTFDIPPIRSLINRYHPGDFFGDSSWWVDPFAGKSSPASHQNDLNPSLCHSCKDALAFLEGMSSGLFAGGFYDPPYSMRQATECYKSYGKDKQAMSVTCMKYWSSCKDELARVISPRGIAICCGWNSMGLGKNRGFEMIEVLIVPHGGNRNDTICTVEKKK